MSTWRRDADREVVMGRVQVFDRPFGEIGLAALAMTAEQAGVELRDPNRDASRSPSKPSNAKPESHTLLYGHPDLRGRIEALRSQSRPALTSSKLTASTSNSAASSTRRGWTGPSSSART
jgi:hypothetical protein